MSADFVLASQALVILAFIGLGTWAFMHLVSAVVRAVSGKSNTLSGSDASLFPLGRAQWTFATTAGASVVAAASMRDVDALGHLDDNSVEAEDSVDWLADDEEEEIDGGQHDHDELYESSHTDSSKEEDDDPYRSDINPATGLMMMGALYIAGNPYGMDLRDDDHHASLSDDWQHSSLSDDLNDTNCGLSEELDFGFGSCFDD